VKVILTQDDVQEIQIEGSILFSNLLVFAMPCFLVSGIPSSDYQEYADQSKPFRIRYYLNREF
jgi:hypothetical protein